MSNKSIKEIILDGLLLYNNSFSADLKLLMVFGYFGLILEQINCCLASSVPLFQAN